MWRWIAVGLIVLWIIAMWWVLIHALVRGWGPYVRSKRRKKTEVRARIKAKAGDHDFDPLNWRMEMTRKVLIFECEDGIERDYDVHDDVWDWVEEGDDGVLTYQGHLFVGFEARRARHDPDKVYKRLTRT